MEYRTLGTSDLQVSRVCLGTMTFGGQVDEPASIEIINRSLERGVNFFDTANIYTRGQSEIIVGKALASHRSEVVLASKCGGAISPEPGDRGLKKATVLRHVDLSLQRLGTDYLDVLYMHFPDYDTSLEEMVDAMATLVQNGKFRYYGVSNFPAWQCAEMVHIAKEIGAPAPVVTQNVYNMITRGLDDELLPCIEKFGIGLVAYNPLAGGLLTGKHSPEKYAEGSRFATDPGYARRYCKQGNFEAIQSMLGVAKELGISPAELAYQWIMSKDYITSAICGVSKMSQLEANLDSCEAITVSEDALAVCDDAWLQIKGDYYNYFHTRESLTMLPPPPEQGAK